MARAPNEAPSRKRRPEPAETGEALFSQGTNASEWLGVTDTALFVMGGIGSNVYRAER